MSAELSPRRQWVLKVIVEEYVASATPVSSETIARKAPTRVSTATLRNEMAALEELGLLAPPAHVGGARALGRGLSLLRGAAYGAAGCDRPSSE